MKEIDKDNLRNHNDLNEEITEYIDGDLESGSEPDNTVYIETGLDDYDVTTSYIDTDTEEVLLNDRYRLLEIAGKGGMGVVYKAEDVRLRGSVVAIKQIKIDEKSGDIRDNLISTFENEASALIRLRHSSIPRVLDYFVTDDMNCCIVMDYIEGNNIYNIVKEKGKMNEPQVLKYLNEISNILTYLHSRNPKIIFRDLKPSNIMIDIENSIKLIDFGIARNFDSMKNNDTAYYVSHGYSAPEQYGFGQSDERSDIYSLGCLLYFMLTAEKPQLNSSNYISNIEKLEISDGLKKAIILAMDYRSDLRPQSITDFMNMVNNKYDVYEKKFTLDKVNNYISNTESKKGINKGLVLLILVIVLVGSIFVGVSKVLEDKSNKNGAIVSQNENDVSNGNKEVSNNKVNGDNDNIEKAREKLYKVTGADKNDVEYELNTEASYIGTEEINKNFYVFNMTTGPYGGAADFNYAVKKSDLSVYYGDTYGMIIPYEDSVNPDSKLNKFLESYRSFGQDGSGDRVQVEFEKLGAEKFLDKITPIVNEAYETTVDYYGGYVYYVDLILGGTTKKELDQYVEGRMMSGTENSPTYDMEKLYKEYGQYDFEPDQIDSIFLEGWLQGFNYISSGNSQSKEDMEDYVYINSPENVGGAIWSIGFWDGYNDSKLK